MQHNKIVLFHCNVNNCCKHKHVSTHIFSGIHLEKLGAAKISYDALKGGKSRGVCQTVILVSYGGKEAKWHRNMSFAIFIS